MYPNFCDEGCMWAMQKKDWMDSNLFVQWMEKFI